MKKYFWATLAGLLGVAAIAAGVTYYCMRANAPAMTGTDGDSLVWLRQEFELTSGQMARVETLHAAYAGVCDAHCAAIMASREELDRLQAAGVTGPAWDEAEAKARRLDAECRASLDAHVRQIADIIGGEQGRRYLATVLPEIAHFDHQGAPDLNPNETGADHGHTAH